MSPAFRAVIVDDEPAARDVIRTFVAEAPEVELVGEAANGREAVEVILRSRPDLVFLDVQMPDLDGFGVLRTLGEAAPPGVVFVTAHDEHALRAFEVHALDYVLKPFGRPRFVSALERALHRLRGEMALRLGSTLQRLPSEASRAGAERAAAQPLVPTPESQGPWPQRLGVRRGPRVLLVDVETIDWIEADGDYARVHAGGAEHLVSERMQGLESILDPRRFLRIHRSVIVNLQRVRELQRDPDGGGAAILAGGLRLRVARSRWEALERALGVG